MFTILLNNDNTALITEKQRIMHRSKLVDTLRFLVEPEYKGYMMSNFTLMMQYLTPATHRHVSEILELSSETYKGYLQYILPVDTDLTAEAGSIEIQLTFSCVEVDENGQSIQRVRKVSPFTIDILPISTWSDIVPDEALNAIDQRLLMVNAQIKAMEEMQDVLNNAKADDLSYEDNKLQLLSNGEKIGNAVILTSSGSCADGVPSVDIDATDEHTPSQQQAFYSVIEF